MLRGLSAKTPILTAAEPSSQGQVAKDCPVQLPEWCCFLAEVANAVSLVS